MPCDPEFVDLGKKGEWPTHELNKLWERARQQRGEGPRRQSYQPSDPLRNFREGRWDAPYKRDRP